MNFIKILLRNDMSRISCITFQLQAIEIEIEEDSLVGMPFVLVSNGNWIKNKGSDFYIEFSGRSKPVQKVASSLIFLQEFIVLYSFFYQLSVTEVLSMKRMPVMEKVQPKCCWIKLQRARVRRRS